MLPSPRPSVARAISGAPEAPVLSLHDRSTEPSSRPFVIGTGGNKVLLVLCNLMWDAGLREGLRPALRTRLAADLVHPVDHHGQLGLLVRVVANHVIEQRRCSVVRHHRRLR